VASVAVATQVAKKVTNASGRVVPAYFSVVARHMFLFHAHFYLERAEPDEPM